MSDDLPLQEMEIDEHRSVLYAIAPGGVLVVRWVDVPHRFRAGRMDVFRMKLDAIVDLVKTQPTKHLANTDVGRKRCASVIAFLGDLRDKHEQLEEQERYLECKELRTRSWVVRCGMGLELLKIQVRTHSDRPRSSPSSDALQSPSQLFDRRAPRR